MGQTKCLWHKCEESLRRMSPKPTQRWAWQCISAMSCTYCELGSRGRRIPRSSWTCELNIVKGKLLRQPVSKKVKGKKCCLTATNVSWDVRTCTLWGGGGWDCMLQIYLSLILIHNSKNFPGLSSLGNGQISPGPHDNLKEYWVSETEIHTYIQVASFSFLPKRKILS